MCSSSDLDALLGDVAQAVEAPAAADGLTKEGAGTRDSGCQGWQHLPVSLLSKPEVQGARGPV